MANPASFGLGMPVMHSGPRVTSTQLLATTEATRPRPSVPTAEACPARRGGAHPARPRQDPAPRPKTPGGPQKDQGDKDRNGVGAFVGEEVEGPPPRLGEADQKARGGGAVAVPEAPRHHRREGFQRER